MAEVKTTNAVNVIEVVQAGPRGPQWSGELTGSMNISGSALITGSLTVSGSETFTNIGPFNNTGSIDSSGSININGSGSFINISSSGEITGTNVSASGDIHIASSSPRLIFNDLESFGSSDNMEIYVQGIKAYIDTAAEANTDLYIKTNSDSNNIVIDGGTGYVGIGSEVDDKTSKLYVAGNLETTSNITSSGTISASLDVIARTGSIGRVEAETVSATVIDATFVGNIAGNATGLTGTPSIDVTNVNASGWVTGSSIFLTDSPGVVTATKTLDLKFHEVVGSTDYIQFTNALADRTMMKFGENGIMRLGNKTAGLDAMIVGWTGFQQTINFEGDQTDQKFIFKQHNTSLFEINQDGLIDAKAGNITTTGNISAASLTGSVNVYSETGSFGQVTSPKGTDSTADTYITLGNDSMTFTCGTVEFAQYQETTQDKLTLGDLSGDVDVAINAAGSFNKFFVSGENGRIAVNTGTVTSAQFTVKGNISGSGDLKIDGNEVDFTNLPNSDPGVLGRLFMDGTPTPGAASTLKISGG